ncbi:MAG: hypothetical protein AAF388_22550 [Bacteroidota bacterium]
MIHRLDRWYYRESSVGVYFQRRWVYQAHESSFESMGWGFGKDYQCVFFKGCYLQHADKNSFHVDPHSGIGEDAQGFRISGEFAGKYSPVYSLVPGQGLQNLNGKSLYFGMGYEEVFNILGDPWQIAHEEWSSKEALSGLNTQEYPLWDWDYRHLGFVASFDQQGGLCQFQLRPEYEDPLGCRILLNRQDIFNTPIHSLKSLESSGFTRVSHPTRTLMMHNVWGLMLHMVPGLDMYESSAQANFPKDQYFIQSVLFSSWDRTQLGLTEERKPYLMHA